jgi:hypothetical protein
MINQNDPAPIRGGKKEARGRHEKRQAAPASVKVLRKIQDAQLLEAATMLHSLPWP